MHVRRRLIPTDAEWIESRVHALPTKWQHRLRRAWERRSPTDYYGANVALREATAALLTVRIPLDATDQDICTAASQLALSCVGGVECGRKARITLATADAEQPGRYGDSASLRPIGVKTVAPGEAEAWRLLVVESSRRT